MPHPSPDHVARSIRSQRARITRARAKLDALYYEESLLWLQLHDEGASIRDIATAAGITKPAVVNAMRKLPPMK